MEENTTTQVIDSEYGYFPEGATLTVTRDNTNQFTDRRVITVEWDDEIEVPNRSVQRSAQFYQMPDMVVWREIHVGLSREHEQIVLEGI